MGFVPFDTKTDHLDAIERRFHNGDIVLFSHHNDGVRAERRRHAVFNFVEVTTISNVI